MSDRDAVVSALEAINAAWLARGPEQIETRLHDSFAADAVMRGGPAFAELARGRRACIASYVDFVRNAQIHGFSSDEPAVDLFGDTAVAVYRWRIEYTLKETRYAETGHDIFVFRRDGTRWVAVWRTMLPGDSGTTA